MLFLKKCLNNPSPEVRFYSAEALAYLGDDSGAEELAKLARDEAAFRVYCVAALSALDEAACFPLLRDLMDEPSAETKYGAFRALWTLDKNDPYIRGVKLNDQFLLHVVNSKGDPMIHLTRHRRPEVVLFGADQKFRTPLALTAGNHININAASGADHITLTRFEVGQPDQRKVVSTRVADVIVAASEMGATYPDIAQLLAQGSAQYNIEGRLELDALPLAGRLYYRTVTAEDRETKKSIKVGRPSLNPNLFPTLNPVGEAPAENDEVELPAGSPTPKSDESGEASLTDIRKDTRSDSTESDTPPAQAKSKTKSPFGWFGGSKSKADEEPVPSKTAEVETSEIKPPTVPTTKGKSLDSDPTVEELPPTQGTPNKFEIE